MPIDPGVEKAFFRLEHAIERAGVRNVLGWHKEFPTERKDVSNLRPERVPSVDNLGRSSQREIPQGWPGEPSRETKALLQIEILRDLKTKEAALEMRLQRCRESLTLASRNLHFLILQGATNSTLSKCVQLQLDAESLVKDLQREIANNERAIRDTLNM
jgi:hypothetical protein